MVALGVLGVVALIWVLSSGIGSPAPAGTQPQQSGAQPQQSGPPQPLAPGTPAPDFTLPNSQGQNVSLSDYRGKTVVLQFFAPWCPHCQEDAKYFNEIQEAYKGQNVEVLGVSASPFGRNYQAGDRSPITMDDIVWFRDTFQVQFPLLFDKDVRQGIVYGVPHFPYVYVINPQGVITAQPNNPVTLETVKPFVEQAQQSALPAAPVAAGAGGSRP